jgi:hypothetical protein
MDGEFVEMEDNFVPDVVTDPYRRKHIRVRFMVRKGQTVYQAEAAAEEYIKEYIEKNTVYHSPQFISESLPPEPAVLPSIQKEKDWCENSLKNQIESCHNSKILETYKFIVRGKPEQELYDIRMHNLLTRESHEIK